MLQERKPYQNVMEIFVDEEIQYQLVHNKTVNPELLSELNLLEVATFALNRLPNLYASSTEGLERQKRQLKQNHNLKVKVATAVAQGFAAVERDPLRRSTPIEAELDNSEDIIEQARKTLTKLGDTLPENELNWLINFMEEFLARVGTEQISEEEIVQLFFLLYYYWQENNPSD
jgi:hypothetical protein